MRHIVGWSEPPLPLYPSCRENPVSAGDAPFYAASGYPKDTPDPPGAFYPKARPSRPARVAYGILADAFMTLSLLALVVLPELHASDKGLFRVGKKGFAFVELLEEGQRADT